MSSADVKSLGLVSRHFRMFATNWLWRRTRPLSAPEFLECYFDMMRYSPACRAAVVTNLDITLTPLPHHTSPSSRSVLSHLSSVMVHLSRLSELRLNGHVSKDDVRDVLWNLHREASLRIFHCEDDALAHASWYSLIRHRQLEELGVFFDARTCPWSYSADVFPRLRVLDTGAPFAMQVRRPPLSLTHLSIRHEWAPQGPLLTRISLVLGRQLLSLRLLRETIPRYVLWGRNQSVEHPLFVCALVRLHTLRYLEIRDTPSTVLLVSTSGLYGRQLY